MLHFEKNEIEIENANENWIGNENEIGNLNENEIGKEHEIEIINGNENKRRTVFITLAEHF